MVKALFAVIIIVFVFAFGMGGMGGGNQGETLALVNDSPIRVKEFEQRYRRSLETMRRQNPNVSREDLKQMEFKQQVLAQMVNSRLLLQQAEELGLYVTPGELRTSISRVPAFQNEQSEFDTNVYRNVLSANRMTPSEFESGYTRDLLLQKLRNFVTLSVEVDEQEARDLFEFAREQVRIEYIMFGADRYMDRVEAGEQEVAQFYETNKERFSIPAKAAFSYLPFTPETLAETVEIDEARIEEYYENYRKQFIEPEMVKARHILFKAGEEASESEVEAARAEAMKAMLRAREGADFAELARELSEGPSAAQGGDLGWFAENAMVEAFAEKAFSLEPGEISDPVRTRFGWHVIKVEDKRDESVKTLDEAGDEIREILAEEQAAGKLQDMLDQALEQIIIGDDLQQVSEKLGIELERTELLTRQGLAAELGMEPGRAKTLFDMVIGQTTDTPIPVEDGYLLASKADFEPAGHRPLEEVRETVVQAVKRNKAMELAKEDAADALSEIMTATDRAEAQASYRDRMQTSEPVGRGGAIQELGMNPSLVEDAFAGDEGDWLPKPYMVSDGYVLARLDERVEPKDDKWEEQKQFWIASLENTRQQELFQSYLSDLREQADVRVVSPEALQ
jgi:peptidyl-prolyl cis-trans isomerase D